MPRGVSIFIDVPDLDAGAAFYSRVFGLAEVARPFPGLVILEGDGIRLGLNARTAGSLPFKGAATGRDYARHWTPVHCDFEVEDFEETLSCAEAAGATVEALYRDEGPRPAAFCADPFGHGFCLMGPRR